MDTIEYMSSNGSRFHIVPHGHKSWIIKRYIGAGQYNCEIFDAAGYPCLVPTGRGSVWFNLNNAIEFMEKNFGGEEWSDHD